jgi:hypothetical protein
MNNRVEGFSAIELWQRPDGMSDTSGIKLPRGPYQRLLAALTVLSLVVGIAGLCFLEVHARTPGETAALTMQWPAGSRISRSQTQPTLVIFFHPRCPCSKAALSELQRLMLKTQFQMRVVAVLVIPQRMPENWSNGGFAQAIAATPGLSRVVDVNADEAEKFGIRTSGHAKLFDRSGRLLFSGGLTASRGHEGDSVGCAAVDRLVSDRDFAFSLPTVLETKVYGCPVTAGSQRGTSPGAI